MQFRVPQFLDIEDKIFGPFTFSQFVYLAGGAGLCFVLYQLLGFFWGALPILMVAGLAGALAFYKPNGKPFVHMVEYALKYAAQDKLYLWQRREKIIEAKKEEAKKEKAETMQASHKKLTGSKLRDLAWSLDLLDTEQRNKK